MSEAREPEEIARQIVNKHFLAPVLYPQKMKVDIASAITSERALVAELVEALKTAKRAFELLSFDNDTMRNGVVPSVRAQEIRDALTRAGAIHE